MKNDLLFYTIFTAITLFACPAQATEKPESSVTAIILDLSPTTRWIQLKAAAMNFYRSSSAGDTILLFTVKGKTTRLRFSSIKRGRDYEFADFASILDAVAPDWFTSASISPALKGQVYKKLLQHTGPHGRAIIALITEGNLSSKQTRSLCRFAAEVKDAHSNWYLIITGTTDKTPRKLLTAAARGQLRWYDIKKAVEPTVVDSWMRQIELKAEIAPQTDSISQNSDTTQSGSKKVQGTKPKATLISTDDSSSPKPAYIKKTPEKKKTKSIVPAPRNPIDKIPNQPTGRKSSSLQKPSLVGVSSSQDKGIERQANSDLPVRKNRLKSHVPKIPFVKRHVQRSVLALGGLSIGFFIVLFIILGLMHAKGLQRKLQAPIKTVESQEQNQSQVLFVKASNVLHLIGDIRRITNFHLGGDQGNVIRLSGSKVASRHLHVFRRAGSWFVRNLARQPVVVNGRELLKHRKCLLTFPAIIRIDDDSSVELFLQKSNKHRLPRKEGDQKNGK